MEESRHTESQSDSEAAETAQEVKEHAAQRESPPEFRVPRVGLEHDQDSTGKTAGDAKSGAESGALGSEIDVVDPDLAEVVRAWPTLPETVRASVVTMVRAATRTG